MVGGFWSKEKSIKNSRDSLNVMHFLQLIDQKMMSPLKIFDESKKFKVPKE